LAFMVIYYLPAARFITTTQETAPAEIPHESLENSIGGPEIPVPVENASLTLEEGVPEPEAFSKPRMLMYTAYKVEKGDVLGEVSKSFGLNTGTLVSLNNIKYTRSIQIGQQLRIPNQDGVIYKVKKGDTLESVAAKNKVSAEDIKIANELFSDKLNENTSLFLPGATMAWEDLQEINGDLFLWPVRSYISSYYGYRRSPFTGSRQFHNGIDIAAPMGTPIRAAMTGRVVAVGYDNVFGNYVIIQHQAGYRTLYGHMSAVRTRNGAQVAAGDRIGDVGATGQTTGPHCHFTVYKNGATINPRNVIR